MCVLLPANIISKNLNKRKHSITAVKNLALNCVIVTAKRLFEGQYPRRYGTIHPNSRQPLQWRSVVPLVLFIISVNKVLIIHIGQVIFIRLTASNWHLLFPKSTLSSVSANVLFTVSLKLTIWCTYLYWALHLATIIRRIFPEKLFRINSDTGCTI